jgi:ribosome biogenesis GTPase
MILEGRILKGVGGQYWVRTGEDVRIVKPRGVFRAQDIKPMVGDRVRVDTELNRLEEILPRTNSLTRPPVANLDMLAIMLSARDPSPDLMMADKLILAARLMDIAPVLILNKIDVSKKKDVNGIRNQYAESDIPFYPVSAKTGAGLDALIRGVGPGTLTLAGQSGVGKSSLVNALAGEALMDIGDLSQKVARGKHTTRHVELIAIRDDLFMVDTPGFSLIRLDEISAEQVISFMEAYAPYQEECRFNGCRHSHEPDCAVKAAVKDGRLDKDRHARYVAILDEIKAREENKWK